MSMFLFIFFIMLFLHILEDYKIQGWLAEGKRKDFWQNFGMKYKDDYKICLIEHGFQNSFMIHSPLLFIFGIYNIFIYISIILYAFIHAYIDDLKANKKVINLIQDQILHIICILIISFIFA